MRNVTEIMYFEFGTVSDPKELVNAFLDEWAKDGERVGFGFTGKQLFQQEMLISMLEPNPNDPGILVSLKSSLKKPKHEVGFWFKNPEWQTAEKNTILVRFFDQSVSLQSQGYSAIGLSEVILALSPFGLRYTYVENENILESEELKEFRWSTISLHWLTFFPASAEPNGIEELISQGEIDLINKNEGGAVFRVKGLPGDACQKAKLRTLNMRLKKIGPVRNRWFFFSVVDLLVVLL